MHSARSFLCLKNSEMPVQEVIKIPPRKTGSTLYAAPRLDIIPESLDEGEVRLTAKHTDALTLLNLSYDFACTTYVLGAFHFANVVDTRLYG